MIGFFSIGFLPNTFSSKLFLYYGTNNNVINELLENDNKIDAIICNKDYTKYAIERSEIYEKLSQEHNIDFIEIEDYFFKSDLKRITSFLSAV